MVGMIPLEALLTEKAEITVTKAHKLKMLIQRLSFCLKLS